MTYGMVIDIKKCTYCRGCTMACKEANGTPPGVTRAKVLRKEEGEFPNVFRQNIPLLCMHCAEPACVEVCPTGATYKRDDGIVVIDKDVCIGCKACMLACPYGARYYRSDEDGYFGKDLTAYEKRKYQDMPAGVVDKCTFCLERLERGEEPACVSVCMTKARTFGTIEELQPLINEYRAFRLLPELGTEPQVYYIA